MPSSTSRAHPLPDGRSRTLSSSPGQPCAPSTGQPLTRALLKPRPPRSLSARTGRRASPAGIGAASLDRRHHSRSPHPRRTRSDSPGVAFPIGTTIMPPLPENEMERRAAAYEKQRAERIAQRKAAEKQPLQNILKIARSLVYPSASNAQPTNNARGADDCSDSEYQPDAEEEADAAEEALRDEEETVLAMSKTTAAEGSTMPKPKKRVRSTNSAPPTSRTTRSRATTATGSVEATNHLEQSAPNLTNTLQARDQMEQTTPNPNNTSPHQTSRDSNSPNADSEMQDCQQMIDTSGQFDKRITVQGQDALVCSTSPSHSRPSRRGRRRRPTMGHGLQDYASRNGGRKMHIDFSVGKVRPTDPVQAAKLSSECGIHIRNKMHVATHWNDYNKEQLDHVIPHAISTVAKNFEMEKDDEVAKGVCTKILQKGVRQQRYRLKRDYFKGRTVEQALSQRPPNITQENWTSLVNKWSDERNQEICEKNKQNREAVKHHQKTGSRCYVAHFNQLKKDKYNNHDPSPIEFFKDTHTNKKTRCMSEPAMSAYTAMEQKRRETQSEGEQPASDTVIVAEVLKDHSAHSTFLSSMGYASTSGRSGSSASSARIRELEERLEQKEREARDANERYQRELAARLEAQEGALEEMKRKQQEELEAVKKSQQDKIEVWEKKQQ